MSALRVGVFGAGAIGSYLGLRLSASGTAVTLIGRRSLVDAADRIHAVTLDGKKCHPDASLVVSEDPSRLADVDICLLTVKSGDTVSAIEPLSRHLGPSVPVVSLQNGMGNAARLREGGLPQPVSPGMISYNVLRRGDAFCQATSGPVICGPLDGAAVTALGQLVRAFAEAGQPLDVRSDIHGVLAGKLLVNLNNGICAATGVPIVEAVRSRTLRLCFAECVKEGLRVMRTAGIEPARVLALPTTWLERVLRLPDAVFLALARSLITIDETARSSTLQDLDRGKPTEIDFLNGELVELAERHGTTAPVNRVVIDHVHRLEAAPRPLRYVEPEELLTEIRAAARG